MGCHSPLPGLAVCHATPVHAKEEYTPWESGSHTPLNEAVVENEDQLEYPDFQPPWNK